MGPDHVYFQRGQLDFFGFQGPCDVRCPLSLQYTKRGNDPDWYVAYFGYAANLPPTGYSRFFPVNKWFTGDYDHFEPENCTGGIPIAKNHPSTAASVLGLAMPS